MDTHAAMPIPRGSGLSLCFLFTAFPRFPLQFHRNTDSLLNRQHASMVPPRNKQQGTTIGFDAYSQRSSCARSSTSTCGVGDVILEFSTPGARSPIHFVDATTAAAAATAAASCRGRPCGGSTTNYGSSSSSRGVRPPVLLRQQSAPASSAARPSTRAGFHTGKHHRRTSTPLDGARLTLLGVSKALNTPVVDNWEVARALLESNTDLRTRNDRGMTPLHLACSTGEVNIFVDCVSMHTCVREFVTAVLIEFQ